MTHGQPKRTWPPIARACAAEPCPRLAVTGGKYCFVHDPDRPPAVAKDFREYQAEDRRPYRSKGRGRGPM